MLQLSKKVEYGLMAVLHLDSLPEGGLVTAKEIAQQYHVPGELLGKVLQALTRAELLESVQGPRGGYRLVRSLDELTLGQVIETLEGPVHLTKCQDEPTSCDQFCACNIREPVLRIQAQLQKFIHGIKLSAFRQATHFSGVKIEVL